MVYDHQFAGLPFDNILEMNESKEVMKTLQQCVHEIISNSFGAAKKKYNQIFKPKNFYFIYQILRDSFKRFEFINPLPVLRRSKNRNGFHFMAIAEMLKAYIKMPFQLLILIVKKVFKKRRATINN